MCVCCINARLTYNCKLQGLCKWLPINDKFVVSFVGDPIDSFFHFFPFNRRDRVAGRQSLYHYDSILSVENRHSFLSFPLKKLATLCLAYGRENNLRLRELTIVIHQRSRARFIRGDLPLSFSLSTKNQRKRANIAVLSTRAFLLV